MMQWSVVGLDMRLMECFLHAGVIGRAICSQSLRVNLVDVRHFGIGPHQSVDDTPYGGGPGMVLRADVLADAVQVAKKNTPARVIALSPQGKRLDAALARELAKEAHLILVCGRYEGIDQRFLDVVVDMEISVGDVVLSQGEVPAMLLIDAVSRFVPGVVGDPESVDQDSFESFLLGVPQYTRPLKWQGQGVPDVLLSGHHDNIREWRLRARSQRTKERRPDLWAKREQENLKR